MRSSIVTRKKAEKHRTSKIIANNFRPHIASVEFDRGSAYRRVHSVQILIVSQVMRYTFCKNWDEIQSDCCTVPEDFLEGKLLREGVRKIPTFWNVDF